MDGAGADDVAAGSRETVTLSCSGGGDSDADGVAVGSRDGEIVTLSCSGGRDTHDGGGDADRVRARCDVVAWTLDFGFNLSSVPSADGVADGVAADSGDS